MNTRLGLKQLLSKYQPVTPVKHYNSDDTHWSDHQTKRRIFSTPKVNRITHQSIQSLYEPAVNRYRLSTLNNIQSEYPMTRQQCKQQLSKLRNSLRYTQQQSRSFTKNIHQEIRNKLYKMYEQIKRQILQLLDQTFRSNQNQIIQYFDKQKSEDQFEFSSIVQIQNQITRLYAGLDGPDYKNCITEVVNRNFQSMLQEHNQRAIKERQEYIDSICSVQLDSEKVDCIREDIQKIFRIQNKTCLSSFNCLGKLFQKKEDNQEMYSSIVQSYHPNGGQSEDNGNWFKKLFS